MIWTIIAFGCVGWTLFTIHRDLSELQDGRTYQGELLSKHKHQIDSNERLILKHAETISELSARIKRKEREDDGQIQTEGNG